MPGLQSIVSLSGQVLDAARGSYVVDVDGRRYLDFYTGVGVSSVGHGNPFVLARMHQQLDRGIVGGFYSEVRSEYLARLHEKLPPGDFVTQFYSTGSEAVEAALRLARAKTGKFEFLSYWGGFHGK